MRPKKSLGQNFLIDPNYKRKIIEEISRAGSGPLLEIGPGRGVLTRELAAWGRPLLLVEKDGGLADILRENFHGRDHVTVWEGDFLEFDLSGLEPETIVVGNLPYNAASQIFLRLIKFRSQFSHLFLMFQKEMALRFTANPSTKDYGLLTLWAGAYTEPRILFHLPPTAFKPRPRVASSFVHFRLLKQNPFSTEEEPFFWNLMRKLFQQRRKTIRSALRAKGVRNVERLGPVVQARAETLTLEQLIALFRLIDAKG